MISRYWIKMIGIAQLGSTLITELPKPICDLAASAVRKTGKLHRGTMACVVLKNEIGMYLREIIDRNKCGIRTGKPLVNDHGPIVCAKVRESHGSISGVHRGGLGSEVEEPFIRDNMRFTLAEIGEIHRKVPA